MTADLLAFSFLGTRPEVEAAVRALGRPEGSVAVIDLSGRLAPSVEGLVRIEPIAEAARGGPWRCRRQAVEWVRRIPMARLAGSGGSVLEAHQYLGVPYWWFFQINLEEDAFLLVRLVESVRRVLRAAGAVEFSVLGRSLEHPWQAGLVARLCVEAGLEEIVHPEPQAPLAPEPVRVDLPPPVAPAAPPSPPEAPAGALLPRSLPIRIRDRLRRDARRARRAMARAASAGRGTSRAIRAGGRRLLRALLRLAGRLRSVARSIADPALLLGPAYRLRIRSYRPEVLIVAEAPNRRAFLLRSTSRRLWTDLHLGGLAPTLRALLGPSRAVTCRHAAALPAGPGWIWAWRRLSALVADRGAFPVEPALLAGDGRRAEAGWLDRLPDEWRTLAADPGFREAFRYDGIDLWDEFSPLVARAFVGIGPDVVTHVEAYRAVLRLVRPRSAVLCNAEGALRGFVIAAAIERVPCLGVQLALGPYQHAIDHGSAGYRPAGDAGPPLGWPCPSTMALWGTAHADRFREYGYPGARLHVTGSPRLDAHAEIRRVLDRRRIRAALGLPPDGRLIQFSAVLRAGGTYITIDERYARTLRALARVAGTSPGARVLVKPWPGDDVGRLRELAAECGGDRVLVHDPASLWHNAELLAAADVLLVDLSHLVAESWAIACPVVFIDYPESRHYFDDEYADELGRIAWTVRDPEEVEDRVRALLALGPEDVAAWKARTAPAVEALFGPADGGAARRIALLARALATGRA